MKIDNSEKEEGYINRPINYESLIDDFFRISENEKKYLNPLINRITSEDLFRYVPTLRVELKDLDTKLIERFKNNPEQFIEDFQNRLFNRLTFEPDVKELFELYQLKASNLHIIPDNKEFENLIPRIKDLVRNKTKFLEKFCFFEARYMTMGIDKDNRFSKIKYRCNLCLAEFDVIYLKNIEKKIKKANFCINGKCKNTDFDVIKSESDSFEMGSFLIDNLDYNKSGNFVNCYILNNIDYFDERIKSINLGEEVEILGILHINYSDLFSRTEKNQRFDYYIEVYDVKPKKLKFFDDSILQKLEKKLKEESSYLEKLIDAIYPLTYLIDIYYPIKLLNVLSFITGGSWNFPDNIRNTLNVIIGGPKSTYKSSISRNLESILGRRHYLVHEVNKAMTKAGLIGTTQRDSNKLTPMVRYGVLPIMSNGTIVLDESQRTQEDNIDVLRCLERGRVDVHQDGTSFSGETKESIVLSQNFTINNDGSFNHTESLFKNLGWKDNNCESRLERFDLLYIIPVPDTFIKLRTLENESKKSKNVLLEEIAFDLELEDFDFPREISSIKDKIEYLLYHYFHRAKEIYREIELPEDIKDDLRNLYRNALIDKQDRYKTDTDVNIRSLNICYKVLKGLSSLRFFKKVINTSFNYFRKKAMKFIIPFRDSELINTKQIDMDTIFKEILSKMTQNEITIKAYIEEIKAYIKRTYYNDKSNEMFEHEITDYIGPDYNLNNYEFKKLLKNNEDWMHKKGFVFELRKGKGNLTVIKKLEN